MRARYDEELPLRRCCRCQFLLRHDGALMMSALS